MYEIERKDGKVRISDWDGKVIYVVSEDSWVVYKQNMNDSPTATQVKKLKDNELLEALAKSVKIPFQS